MFNNLVGIRYCIMNIINMYILYRYLYFSPASFFRFVEGGHCSQGPMLRGT